MNAGWLDTLPMVKRVDELLELMRVGPTAADLHKTHELMAWLTAAIAALAIVVFFAWIKK